MPGCRARRRRTRDGIRTGRAPGWTLRTVAAILANPRYTGRQVWNRQRTDFDLADPANTGLGHGQVQRWNLPEGWVISKHPAHAALISEADFIAAQNSTAPRGPAGQAVRRYLLAGCWAGADGGWNQPGPTASPPTDAATAIPAPPAQTPAGPGTPTSVRTRSCRTWPPSASSSATLPGHQAAGAREQVR